MNNAQINHLRRLLAWVSCEVGQSPAEYLETIKKISPAFPNPDEWQQQVMVDNYRRAQAVPKYIRAAIKSLEPLTHYETKDVQGSPEVLALKTIAEFPDVPPSLNSANMKLIAKKGLSKHGN